MVSRLVLAAVLLATGSCDAADPPRPVDTKARVRVGTARHPVYERDERVSPMIHRAPVRAPTRAFGPGTRPAQSWGGGIGRGGDPGIHAAGVGGPGWPPSEVG